MMGASTVLIASKCGSGAHRPIRIWQNLLPKEELDQAYSNMHDPPHMVNDIVELAGLGSWHMPAGDTTNPTANPPRALPRLRTRPTTPPPGGIGPVTNDIPFHESRDSPITLPRS